MTVKQQRFIEYYLGESNGNGVDAARKAGYAGSYSALGVIAHDNLKNPKISVEIKRRLEERAMPQEEVIARLASQAKGIGEYVEFLPGGRPYIDVERMKAEGNGHLLKGVKYTDKGQVILEFYDAQSALVQLGRYYKLFTDKTEGTMSVNHTFEDELSNLSDEELRTRLAVAAGVVSPESE